MSPHFPLWVLRRLVNGLYAKCQPRKKLKDSKASEVVHREMEYIRVSKDEPQNTEE